MILQGRVQSEEEQVEVVRKMDLVESVLTLSLGINANQCSFMLMA